MTLHEMHNLIINGKVSPVDVIHGREIFEIENIRFLQDIDGQVYSDFDHEYWEIVDGHDN